MATPIHTGFHELNDLIAGPGENLVDWCPGYPLGRITQFLVDEQDHEEVFNMLKDAFVKFPARWYTHRTGTGANGQEMLEGLWLNVTAPAAPAPVQAVYDMGADMTPELRYKLWGSLMPRLRTVLREHERTCVLGFSIKGQDTKPERTYPSLRIEVTRVEGGFEFKVIKSLISAAAGYSIVLAPR
jgi:hypothetical protein